MWVGRYAVQHAVDVPAEASLNPYYDLEAGGVHVGPTYPTVSSLIDSSTWTSRPSNARGVSVSHDVLMQCRVRSALSSGPSSALSSALSRLT